MLKVLLAGGGTAGHVNPAIAIAELIKEKHPDAEFLFVGTPNGLESSLVPKAGYNFKSIKVMGFQRKPTPENVIRNIKAISCLLTAGKNSKAILKKFKPDLVVGTGGYVSGPIVLKASQMGIKTAIHEQNAYAGVTTKLLSKKVDKVMLTVEEAAKHLSENVKYTVTGLPIRGEFSNIDKREARRKLGLDDNICILSAGGSLGAGRINETVSDLIKWCEDNLLINHIHGYGGMGKDTFLKSLTEKGINPQKNNRLIVKEYIDDMPTCMAAADIVIGRCGANFLNELEATGKPSILIPSPIVAENHQYHNGMVLVNAGAAVMIEQKDLTSELLIKKVKELCENKKKLENMSVSAKSLYIKDSRDRVYAVLNDLLKN